MRFHRLEIVALAVSAALVILALIEMNAFLSSYAAAENGPCIRADVTRTGAIDSRLLGGRWGAVAYDYDNDRYEETLHYEGVEFREGARVTICVDEHQPSSFFLRPPDFSPHYQGYSHDWWYWELLGHVAFGLGGAALFLILYKHQWRFTRQELDEAQPQHSSDSSATREQQTNL
jgi:hypothetical protein